MALCYRPASLEDSELLFQWRNDPQTRAMSRNIDPILWADHKAWLHRRLKQQNPDLFVVIEDGAEVGTFRIDGDEVSYTVAPQARARGLGTAILKLVRQDFGPVTASIKAGNLASIKAAQSAGLRIVILQE